MSAKIAKSKLRQELKLFHFKKEKLNLACEWIGCEVTANEVLCFIDHVSSHAEGLVGQCQWSGCSHWARTKNELLLHVSYHAFHTKIKCLGGNLLARKKMASCIVNRDSRNMIPELPETLCCYFGQCRATFSNPELYYQHVNQHTKDNVDPCTGCKWDECKAQFGTAYKLQEHLRSHTQERLIACPTCGALYANRTKFFDHIKRQITKEDYIYECSHCSKKLASERLLRDHMRNHINHYKCPRCDMTCTSVSNLNNHMRYRHLTERPFPCEFCEYSGKRQSDLCKHLETHLREAQFKCRECAHTSHSAQSLELHISKNHTGAVKEDKSYLCHLCDKRFARGAYLTRHLFKQHKLRWPSGHSRFRYKRNANGTYQLETVRYESIDLIQALEQDDEMDAEDVDSDEQSEDFQPSEDCAAEQNFSDLNSSDTTSGGPSKSSEMDVTLGTSAAPLTVSPSLVESLWSDEPDQKKTVFAAIIAPDGKSQQLVSILLDDGMLAAYDNENQC